MLVNPWKPITVRPGESINIAVSVPGDQSFIAQVAHIVPDADNPRVSLYVVTWVPLEPDTPKGKVTKKQGPKQGSSEEAP